MQFRRASRPLTDRWRHLGVEPHGTTRLGISFRPRQVEALGLDQRTTLSRLLTYPFQIIRLGAYWNRIEPEPGVFDPQELDWQVEAAEQAGKQIILCIGAVKTFGYPEFFVPAHHLPRPLPEGRLVTPSTHPPLLAATISFVSRIVERYRKRPAVIAWQVEHEAVDPLGLEHSWRLAISFVENEVETARRVDPSRPIILNGYLPMSVLEQLPQWWRTRDQGDSLSLAQRLADIVGIDYYPRHALVGLGPWTLYVNSGSRAWRRREASKLAAWAHSPRHQLMISEGQAEPWEQVTTPPNPSAAAMYSCPPEQIIANYNRAIRWARLATVPLSAFLFWGAEYWVLRHQTGDSSYLDAFRRVLDASASTSPRPDEFSC